MKRWSVVLDVEREDGVRYPIKSVETGPTEDAANRKAIERERQYLHRVYPDLGFSIEVVSTTSEAS